VELDRAGVVAMRPVTLIVLAWNQWPTTQRCLETLQRTDREGSEVLVVDNGSTDETPQRLADLSWLRVLRLPTNVGFVRGNNAGIEAANPESDVVLLNNDLEFYQHDWLQRLRACAHDDPHRGVVGCRLTTPAGTLLHAGSYILADTLWGQQIGSGEKDLGQYTQDRDVQGIVFACAYLRREVLAAIGGLSQTYHSYFEDTDYCLRAQRAGFGVRLCGGVTLVHDEHASTRTDNEMRLQLFKDSQRSFGAEWREPLASRYRRRLLWQSIMNFPTGYARSTREYLHALDESNVETAYRYVYGPGTVFPKPEPEQSGDYLLNLLATRSDRGREVAVVYGQGDVFERNRGRYKIGFTMLEVNGFPPEWVRQANQMDEVWVPSESNRQAFLDSGLTSPIHVIPLGVNTDYFHPQALAFPNPSEEYVFLACFEWGERKEPWLLLQAFSETFSVHEPVRLVAKIINVDPSVSLVREIANLKLQEMGGRISYILNREFPHYQLPSLYRSADCYLSTSRGEGWDMPLMEAMACALPAIATDWGAHQEFVHAAVSYPLRIRGLVPARARCPYYDGFSWADPDPEHLRYLLRHVFEHREEAAALGRRAAAEMAERWTWRQAAARIVTRLDEIAG
jgi:GT2 family glycosyltransferase